MAAKFIKTYTYLNDTTHYIFTCKSLVCYIYIAFSIRYYSFDNAISKTRKPKKGTAASFRSILYPHTIHKYALKCQSLHWRDNDLLVQQVYIFAGKYIIFQYIQELLNYSQYNVYLLLGNKNLLQRLGHSYILFF